MRTSGPSSHQERDTAAAGAAPPAAVSARNRQVRTAPRRAGAAEAVTAPTSSTAAVTQRPDLARLVNPAARSAPVHRRFVLGHGFSPEIVDHLADRWRLKPGAVVLDPLCGAGTALVSARRRGLRAIGMDLSPLAVLASTVKAADVNPSELRKRCGHAGTPRASSAPP